MWSSSLLMNDGSLYFGHQLWVLNEKVEPMSI
jgi:hypothetical protein